MFFSIKKFLKFKNVFEKSSDLKVLIWKFWFKNFKGFDKFSKGLILLKVDLIQQKLINYDLQTINDHSKIYDKTDQLYGVLFLFEPLVDKLLNYLNYKFKKKKYINNLFSPFYSKMMLFIWRVSPLNESMF